MFFAKFVSGIIGVIIKFVILGAFGAIFGAVGGVYSALWRDLGA